MSVVVRRMMRLGGWAEAEADATLQNLHTLLQSALSQTRNHGGQPYTETILLATALVNATTNDRSRNRCCQALARQSATTVLSILSSIMNLIPDLSNLDEKETQYMQALLPHLQSIKKSLVTAHSIVVRILSSSVFQMGSTYEAEADQCCKELNATYKAFSLRMSFFTADQELTRKKESEPGDTDGHVLSWNQVNLREACQLEPIYDLIKDYKERQLYKVRRDTFWDDTFQAVTKGRPVIVKTYRAEAIENFRHDIEVLKTQRHSNLPALFGYSAGRTSKPFIVMAMESFVPFLEYLPVLSSQKPESALGYAWKMLISMRRTAEHLVTSGMINHQDDLWQCMEAAVVDASGKVVLSPSYMKRSVGDRVSIEDIPYGFSFVYTRNGGTKMDANFPTIDNLPRNLRPLRYALMENPSEALHPSYARLDDPKAQRAALARWRPGAARRTRRNIAWPVPFDSTMPVAVGDYGWLLKTANGQSSFVRLGNAQDAIGGHVMKEIGFPESYEHVSRNVWKFIGAADQTSHFFRWTITIPMDMALDFLSLNAGRIGREAGVLPENIVLITEVMLDLHANIQPKGTSANMFVHFDKKGRPIRAYWSDDQIGPDLNEDCFNFPDISIQPSISIRPIHSHCIKYVQVEDDELKEDQASESHDARTRIGDICYFRIEPDGNRSCRVLANMADDMVEYELRAWRGNPCHRIHHDSDSRTSIWCSPPIEPGSNAIMKFNWDLSASSGIPEDLERFYMLWVASEGGTRDVVDTKLRLVKNVVHQVVAKPPSDVDFSVRLIVHFNEEGQPHKAYWFESDLEKSSGRIGLPPWAVENVTIRLGISNELMDSKVFSKLEEPMYQRVDSSHLANDSKGSKELSNHPKNGDVGYWARDSNGQLTDNWVHLGRLQYSNPETKHTCIHTSLSANTLPCKEVAPGFYASKRLDPSKPESRNPLHYRWTVRFDGDHAPSDYLELLDTLVKDNGIPREDILYVDTVIWDVHASASEAAFNPRIKFNEKLRLCALFSKDLGCYAYWSRHDHTTLNYKLLPKLDLDNWQLSGCSLRRSITIERRPLADLLSPKPSKAIYDDHNFGEKIGDMGWDIVNYCARTGMAQPPNTPPILVLLNMFDHRGSRDLKVLHHGSTVDTPCSEFAPGIWRSEPFDSTCCSDAALYEHEWWFEIRLDFVAVLDEACDMGKLLVKNSPVKGVYAGDFQFCIGMNTKVKATLPQSWSNRSTHPKIRFITRIETLTPLRTKFYWCTHEDAPCEDGSCCHITPEDPEPAVSYSPVLENVDILHAAAKIINRWNHTIVLDNRTRQAFAASMMNNGYVPMSAEGLYTRDQTPGPLESWDLEEREPSGPRAADGSFRGSLEIW